MVGRRYDQDAGKPNAYVAWTVFGKGRAVHGEQFVLALPDDD